MKLLPIFFVGFLRVVQSFFNKKSSSFTDTMERNLKFGTFFEFAAAFFSLLYLFIAGLSGINLPTLVCVVLTGAGFLLELLTALAAMRCAPITLCSFCALGGGIIIPAIAGIFFFDEPMTLFQWGGVLLFFVAAYLLSPSDKSNGQFDLKKTFLILFSNFIINGSLGVISKYFALFVKDNNAALYSFGSYAVAGILFGLFLLYRKKGGACDSEESVPLPKSAYLFGTILGATCATIVYVATTLSRTVPVVILNTVPNAICIVGSLVVGCIVFRERLTVVRVIGAVLSIVSTILVISVI